MESRIRFGFCLCVTLMVMVFGSFCCGMASGQTYNEVFRQRKTQEVYLLKQLAYLKLYAGQLKRGYEVVSGGLNTVKKFTAGEFSLHEAFFQGFAVVSSVVRNDGRIREIISLQQGINSSFRDLQRGTVSFSPAQLIYVAEVRDKVLEECSGDLMELMSIVLSGKVELKDKERLERLSKLHRSMLEKADFVKWFYVEAMGLGETMKRERVEVKDLRRFYEIN